MFNKIIYVTVITVLIIITAGLFLPKAAHVERTIEIARPAATVFTLVNGFSKFSLWSPWSERDPDVAYSFSGPAAGPGAQMSWKGDPRLVGTGTQRITESIPWSMVRMQIDFDQLGKASSYFQIDESGHGSHLTWGFDVNLVEGRGFFTGLLNRYFALFFDTWMGADYEQGLSRLKSLAESMPAADFSDIDVEFIQAEPLDILYVARTSRQAAGGVSPDLAAAYQEITALMAEHSVEMASQPMAIHRTLDAENHEFDAAIPVTETDIPLSRNVQAGKSPAGPAIRVVYRGSYAQVGLIYEKLAAYMAVHDIEKGRVSWEHYISDPARTSPNEAITHIYQLIKNPPPELH